MAAATPFTVRWGILATGGIAKDFTRDLLTEPASRGVDDVRHVVAAAASSTSQARAADFLREVGAPATARAYGSYAELAADADVDIVYVATPHSHHFQNTMLVLTAGKPVLCEKAFTVTAAQARQLVATARAKQLFLMEAVWTRYFPLSEQIRALVQAGTIGTVYRVTADNSINANVDSTPHSTLAFADDSRMVNLALAGGATLDLGIYALTWLFQILYHLQPDGIDSAKEPPKVLAAMNQYRTGADESVAIVLQFPHHGTLGIATTSLRFDTGVVSSAPAGPAILIQGSAGEIQVTGPAYQPLQYRVVTRTARDAPPTVRVVDCPIPKNERPGNPWTGRGMFWEADEAARCLRDGRLESATLPLDESVVIMETMEEALRQGGIVYPAAITSDVYEPDGALNTGRG